MAEIKNIKQIFHFANIKNKKEREKFLNEYDDEIVREIVEILANFLIGKIKVSNKALQNIRSHKNKIRKLSRTKSFKNAKKTLIQTGGWANILVPLLVTIGGSLITKLLNEIHK